MFVTTKDSFNYMFLDEEREKKMLIPLFQSGVDKIIYMLIHSLMLSGFKCSVDLYSFSNKYHNYKK